MSRDCLCLFVKDSSNCTQLGLLATASKLASGRPERQNGSTALPQHFQGPPIREIMHSHVQQE